MKPYEAVKFEREAVEALTNLLQRIPIVSRMGVRLAREHPDVAADAILDFRVGDQTQYLICEVKSNGQPRIIRDAINELKHFHSSTEPAASMVIAPYLSETTRKLCLEAGVNYFDLHGNFRLALDNLFIEGMTTDKPAYERRDLKSLFRPKSARILRWLMRNPRDPVRLKEIAEGARVSLGQVHNVKEGLLARDWAETTPDGLVLTDPDGLVDTWCDEYEAPPAETREYYTVRHGEALVSALTPLMIENCRDPGLALRNFSAANWLAPYGRSETTQLYVWPDMLPRLEKALSLEPAAKGANVVIKILEEESILLDAIEAVDGVVTTSPLQTYLDLYASGDRGREAAEFLRGRGFGWVRS